MSESLHASDRSAGCSANRTGRNPAKRRATRAIAQICRQITWQRFAPAAAVAIAGLGVQAAYAQNCTWAAGNVVSDSSVSSTKLSTNIGVTKTYAPGDMIQFTGGSTSNPFYTGSSSSSIKYIVSVNASAGTIQTSASPTGSPLSAAAINTSAGVSTQFQDWLSTANWGTTNGVANSSNAVAVFSNQVQVNVPGVVINGAVTINGLTYAGGHVLNLVSGANGTGLNALNFNSSGVGVPYITQTAASSSVFLNFGIETTNGYDLNFPLALAGTKGLALNNQTTVTASGTGLNANSSNCSHSIEFTNLTYPSSFGGIIAQEGELNLDAANALGTGTTIQNLTVGNSTSATATLLAGVSLASGTAIGGAQVGGETVGSLTGNAWGRIWTSVGSSAQTLTVGGNNASGGNFAGIIGTDFTGTALTTTINLATTGNGTQIISGNIVGSGSVTVNGAGGNLNLSGANTYTGGTTVIAGTLTAGNNSSGTSGAFGPSTSVVTLGAASSNLAASVLTGGAFNISNPITVAAGDTGLLAIGGGNNSNSSFSGAITVNSNLTVSEPATSGGHFLNVTGGITGGTGAETVTFSGSGSINVNTNPITDGGGTISVAVSGGIQPTVFMTPNTYSGGTTFASGTLYLGNAGAIGTTGTLSFTGGVMQYSPNNQTDYSSRFSTAANQQYNIDTNNQAVTFSTALTSSGGSLTKLGLGALTLAASNTYSGATTVQAGTLVAGAANSLSPLSAVIISGGTLDASSFNNSIASLNISSGTLKLGASTVLTDTGSATFAGALNLVGTPVSLPDLLMTFAGTATGAFATNNLPAGESLSYTGGELEVVSTGGPASLTWVNAASNGQWDIATSTNWNTSSSTVTYSDTSNASLSAGDNVLFNDSNGGPSNYNVSIAATVHPTSVTVNTNSAYTFNGSGGIAGPGSLTLSGSGSLTLKETNSYSGGTNVSSGTLILGVAGALPSGTNLSIGSLASVVASNLSTGLTVNTLSNSGKLDLGNNKLTITTASLTTISNDVAAGYSGGTWNGSGATPEIFSSAAANDTTHLTALGVMQNGTGVVVKYTYYGDADLSGIVDGSDYSRIDNAFLYNQANPSTPLTGWNNGDFNYDGVVNGSDYTLIDNAFNTQAGQISAQIAIPTAQIAGSGATSAVPEPTSLGLLAIGVVGLLGRKRGRRD